MPDTVTLPTMTARQVDSNPNMPDPHDMTHWRCTLRYRGRRMTLVFSMGSGHNGREPEVREVLSCMFLDSSGVATARDFEDWCSEYGYDPDIRGAERVYRGCVRQATALRRLLGDDYDAVGEATRDA